MKSNAPHRNKVRSDPGRGRTPALLLSLIALLLLCTAAAADEFFVAPNGGPSGNGTVSSPWDLATALAQPGAVKPGDTIWLRGGTYPGTFTSNLTGTAVAPIKVRQYPGERATIDGGNSNGVTILEVYGGYTQYMGFEIMSSDPNRGTAQLGPFPSDIGRGGGIEVAQGGPAIPGVKFINLVIHDTGGGVGLWKEAVDPEVYGCIIYYDGWDAPDRGHGHGIYTQNQTGTQRIRDNILFSAFGHGIHSYGSGIAYLDNIHIEGNVSFNNGILASGGFARNLLLGGGQTAQDPKIINNYLYYPGAAAGNNLNLGYYPWGAGTNNAVVTGNYIAGGDALFSDQNVNTTMTDNLFYTAVASTMQAQYPSNTYLESRPTGVQVFVRANAFEAGRAHIIIYNWDLAGSVDVDLTNVLLVGSRYEIRNVQDYFGLPVRTGTFTSGPLTLPMAGLSIASPVGMSAPPATGPEFNVFILSATTPASTCDPTYGDLNQDGVVNAADLGILSDYLVGNVTQGKPPFTASLSSADLDLSGGVNTVDLVLLHNYVAGNLTCLPRP